MNPQPQAGWSPAGQYQGSPTQGNPTAIYTGNTQPVYYGPAFGPNYTPPSSGSTLGASTGPVYGPPSPAGPPSPQGYSYTGTPTSSAPDFGSNPNPTTNQQHAQDIANQQAALQSMYNDQRNSISSGWDQYTGQLNDILNNGLPQQQTSQNNIINDQYNQGANTINSQKATSLKDIANNIKNAFQAGNIYLGARGAGDSSAANQYSFALNQEGAKQNSDLNQYVNTQLTNLSSQRDQQLNSVANWVANAQNQLKQQIASGAIGKSQDLSSLSQNILNQGLSALNQIQQNSQSQYNSLVQWAANNSGSLGQLQSNIAAIPQPVQPMMVGASGGAQAPVGYGYSNNSNQNQQQNGLFSNPGLFG